MKSMIEERDLLALNSLVKEQKLFWMSFSISLSILALSVYNILVLSHNYTLFAFHMSLLHLCSNAFVLPGEHFQAVMMGLEKQNYSDVSSCFLWQLFLLLSLKDTKQIKLHISCNGNFYIRLRNHVSECAIKLLAPFCKYNKKSVLQIVHFSVVSAFVLQVADAVLRDYIFVHLDDNIDKFNLLMLVSLVFASFQFFAQTDLFRLSADSIFNLV